MSRNLYSLILYLLTPLVLLRLLWRSRGHSGYRQRWCERFAWRGVDPDGRPLIWVHAVSVGEVQAARGMIRHLLESCPGHQLLVTTTTPTGSDRVRELFGDQVLHVYMPYDLPGAVNRFVKHYQPVMAVIMETEIWPNLFAACGGSKVPLVIANARLSEKSAHGYNRLQSLVLDALRHVSVIAVQSQDDMLRFTGLGVSEAHCQVTGSIKFDMSPRASIREQGESLRLQLGSDRPVWIAASTHEGEDEPVLKAHADIRHLHPGCLLLLVPRHPERAQRINSMARKAGFNVVSRTSGQPCSRDCDVLIVDTLGELELFYAASDVAFVGGSLVGVGGHNMLEPAALGVPVLTGPHTFNFSVITRMMLDAGAAREVSVDTLPARVSAWLEDANARHAAGERGLELVEANRGALERLNSLIDDVLTGRKF